jgi:tetratricopeptide (TPR) repeat protein
LWLALPVAGQTQQGEDSIELKKANKAPLRADCYQQADGDRTIAACTLIIQDQSEIAGSRVAAYHNRGVAYYTQGDYDRAIEDYNEEIRRNPLDATAYYNRGLAFHAKGDYGRAIADYSEAITRDPKYETELEADFRSLNSVAYESLTAEQRAKREALRKEQAASPDVTGENPHANGESVQAQQSDASTKPADHRRSFSTSDVGDTRNGCGSRPSRCRESAEQFSRIVPRPRSLRRRRALAQAIVGDT